MRESLMLHQGSFGRLSILNIASGFVPHAHREAQVVLWMDGHTGDMTVGGRKVRPSPDTAVCTNSYEPHSHNIVPDNGLGHLVALYIDPDWLRRRCGIAERAAIFPSPAIPITPPLREAANNLLGDLARGYSLGPAGLCEIERFIDQLMEAVEADRPRHGPLGQAAGANDFRIRKAIGLMRANVTRRIRLDEVARAAGLSRPHFFALFKEQLNLTPNIYWNTLRMEEACRQLRHAENNVTSVASVLGFTTEGNFCRFFRDHIGVPPTVYRSAAHLMAPAPTAFGAAPLIRCQSAGRETADMPLI
jgi:AraC-like DNA-binding protein